MRSLCSGVWGGSIPASAGEAAKGSRLPEVGWVHPRERGGSAAGRAPADCWPGPSPRARGKRGWRRTAGMAARSIPASAGEAAGRHWSSARRTVHPRERGGSGFLQVDEGLEEGPSPRARGKRCVMAFDLSNLRSIPASAGEACLCSVERRLPGVHPRERGGSTRALRQAMASSGPSPRARGKQQAVRLVDQFGRSIPASAGEARRKRPR